MSLQVCGCCGWSKVTTYHGLRVHQGKKGCTPKGMRIPESEQFRFNSFTPKVTFGPTIKVEEPVVDIFTPSFKSVFETPQQSYHTANNARRALDFSTGAQQAFLAPMSQTLNARLADAEAKLREANKSLFETPQHSYHTTTNVRRALDFSTDAQQAFLAPMSQTLNARLADAEAKLREANKSLFETPQHSYHTTTNVRRALDFSTDAQQVQAFLAPMLQTLNAHLADTEAKLREANKSLFETPQHSYHTTTNVRRALDFSTGAQQVQVGQLPWDLPTNMAQETAVQPNEKEREKEREAQKLRKAKQARIRADLQQEIQMREQKMAEVRSSAEACKGSLDTECQEINSVFSEVMRIVEDTWKKALQPLKKRRHRVKREAQDLIKKLQKETDKLKTSMDELDQNPDFQVSPPKGLDESQDWKNVTFDSSVSLGTLRSQTSKMMQQIQQKLERLSSVELKRIPTFAVDVKLDPATAHRCLALSLNGKEVRDGGKNPKVPVGPERFDKFGSILGLNRLTAGKSYWEVEVSNKTGWDLGVARRNASRKGILSLTPDNGYWVTVHYEGEKYAALSAPPVSLSLKAKPQKVGVFVDYEEGLVSFYDVTAQSHIYSFTECSFSDEICPYFSPHLQQNEKNSDPLVISAVKKH